MNTPIKICCDSSCIRTGDNKEVKILKNLQENGKIKLILPPSVSYEKFARQCFLKFLEKLKKQNLSKEILNAKILEAIKKNEKAQIIAAGIEQPNDVFELSEYEDAGEEIDKKRGYTDKDFMEVFMKVKKIYEPSIKNIDFHNENQYLDIYHLTWSILNKADFFVTNDGHGFFKVEEEKRFLEKMEFSKELGIKVRKLDKAFIQEIEMLLS